MLTGICHREKDLAVDEFLKTFPMLFKMGERRWKHISVIDAPAPNDRNEEKEVYDYRNCAGPSVRLNLVVH